MKTGIENLVGWLKKNLNGEPQVSDELGSSINLKEKLMNERVIKKQDPTQCQLLPIDLSCFSSDFNLKSTN